MKKNIHITLVGGQLIPLYVGWMHDLKQRSSIDTLVLVHSEDTLSDAQRFTEIVAPAQCHYIELSATDIKSMEQEVARLVMQFAESDIVVNISGGLKPWSLLFYQHFSPQACCLYVDQNNLVTYLSTFKTFQEELLDMETRFRLQKQGVPKHRKLTDYTDEDFKDVERLEKLRKQNYKDFNLLTSPQMPTSTPAPWVVQSKGTYHSPKGDPYAYISWDKKEHWIEMSFFHRDRRGYVTERFSSPNAFNIVFYFAWFELKTAFVLKELPGVRDIWVNCEFQTQEGSTKNEIDIIVDMGAKLCFIECKTMIYNTTDLDKFASAMRNFAGLSSKGFFVTLDRPSLKSTGVYSQAKEKCQDNKLGYFNFGQYQDAQQQRKRLPSLVELISQSLPRSSTR